MSVYLTNIKNFFSEGLTVRYTPYTQRRDSDPKGLLDASWKLLKLVPKILYKATEYCVQHPSAALTVYCLMTSSQKPRETVKIALIEIFTFQPLHPFLPPSNIYVNLMEARGLKGVDDDQNGCIDDVYGCKFHRNVSENEGIISKKPFYNGHFHSESMLKALIANLDEIEEDLPIDRLKAKDGVQVINFSINNSSDIAYYTNAIKTAKLMKAKIINLSIVLTIRGKRTANDCQNTNAYIDTLQPIKLRNDVIEYIQAVKEFPGVIVSTATNFPVDLTNDPAFHLPPALSLDNMIVVSEYDYLNSTSNRTSPSSGYNSPSFTVANYQNNFSYLLPCMHIPDRNDFIACRAAENTIESARQEIVKRREEAIGDEKYKAFPNTSGATAKTSAVIALMYTIDPNLTPQEIKDIIRNTGTTIYDRLGNPVYKINKAAALALTRSRLSQKN